MKITLKTPLEIKVGDGMPYIDVHTNTEKFDTVKATRLGRCEGANVVWVTTEDDVCEPYWMGQVEVYRG